MFTSVNKVENVCFFHHAALEDKIRHLRNIKIKFLGKSPDLEPFPANFLTLKQNHGTQSIGVNADTMDKAHEGDIIYTQEAHLAIAVRTADCIPILLFSDDVVMAIHAGWRGLCANIIAIAMNTIYSIDSFPSQKSLRAVVGPTLCREHFEVEDNVRMAFCSPMLDLPERDKLICLKPGKPGKHYIDLSLAATLQLIFLGIPPAHILATRSCTFCDSDLWYSYRRDKNAFSANYSVIERIG